jgi:predicted permease
VRAPGFALAVVLTLGLGIGANTAVFSVVRGVLLRPLPHQDGERLVYLRHSAALAGVDNALFSVPEILDYRGGTDVFEGIAEFSSMTFNLIGRDEPVQVTAGIVSGNFFDVMGLEPALERLFGPGDDGEAAAPVMVLTFDYWMEAFGGDPGVVGATLEVNGRSSTIVGVLQPVPQYPEETDVLVNMVTSPHHMSAAMVHGRTHRMTEVFARLAPGATVEQAQGELDRVGARVRADHPDSYDEGAGYAVTATPLQEVLTRRARLTVWLLMGTAAFVLVIACANVANLPLMRGVRREREMVVRGALGAGAVRLRRLLLVENLLLTLVGAALGLALALAGVDLLVAFAERYTPRASEIRLDGGVLAFALGVAGSAAVALAFAPALPGERTAGASLAGGRRSTGGVSRQRIQRALVVAQVAVSVVVLTGAGLLARTLINLYEVDAGVDVRNVLTLEVPEGGQRTFSEAIGFYEEIQARMAALPGVVEVGMGSNVPLRGTGFLLEVKVDGQEPVPGQPIPRAEFRTATPEYFRAAGIPLLGGREFASTDRADAARVVILNETLAERLFGDRDPIGQRVAWTGDVLRFIPVSGDWRTVVGVVGDTKDEGLDAEPGPVLYQPFAQEEVFDAALLIRSRVDAATLGPTASRIVQDLDPRQPVANLLTLERIRDESVAPRRLNAMLVGAFGVLALAIAAVGIAGVLAFSVSARTGEIGVRMSLGADAGRVQRMVLGEGGVLLVLGLVLGIAGALAGSRLLAGLLFDVAPGDPWTLATVSLLVGSVGLASCWIPAARAARVQPAVAMRAE